VMLVGSGFALMVGVLLGFLLRAVRGG
jgi:hypothetical protein